MVYGRRLSSNSWMSGTCSTSLQTSKTFTPPNAHARNSLSSSVNMQRNKPRISCTIPCSTNGRWMSAERLVALCVHKHSDLGTASGGPRKVRSPHSGCGCCGGLVWTHRIRSRRWGQLAPHSHSGFSSDPHNGKHGLLSLCKSVPELLHFSRSFAV